jgi:energy-coupling factor transporter transmembrane protein EcfT
VIDSNQPQALFVRLQQRLALGTIGYLILFLWCLGMVMLVPQEYIPIAAIACITISVLLFPLSPHRLFHWRWLFFMLLLALPPVFFLGEIDRSFWGLGYSSEGLLAGLQIALRFIVVLIALNGLTGSVEITAIAGLLERVGLQGLGFSMGVALNLLPSLQQSSINAWHSLWMRGGLRRQRWRGLRLLAFSILTNALRRAEEIALAAEARAFSPELSRAMPIVVKNQDWLILFFALASLVTIVILR